VAHAQGGGLVGLWQAWEQRVQSEWQAPVAKLHSSLEMHGETFARVVVLLGRKSFMKCPALASLSKDAEQWMMLS
jgi:hypothetical protein